MSKFIHITFSNGDVYRIDALIAAKSRATYYSSLDFERGDAGDLNTAYTSELEYSLTDHLELLDWVDNNMDWSDFKESAELVSSSNVDCDIEFTNARKEVVEE